MMFFYRSKCSICEEVFWTDALFRQHWRKCVSKWVKSAKHEQENAALEQQLILQMQQQEQLQQVQMQQQEADEQLLKENIISATASDFSAVEAAETLKKEYLCAFCQFLFTTKEGYMEHTKLGQCAQVINKTEKASS
jgi:cytidylate kinase